MKSELHCLATAISEMIDIWEVSLAFLKMTNNLFSPWE